MKNKSFFWIFIIIANCSLLIAHCEAQWTEITTGLTTPIIKIECLNPDTVYALGSGDNVNPSIMIKTTDGGNTWTPLVLNSDYHYGEIVSFHCFNKDTIYAITKYGVIFKTFDRGENWNIYIPSYGINFVKDIFYINPEILWIASEDSLYKTIDGGKTWETENICYQENITTAYFINTDIGFVATENLETTRATLYKSINGGKSWNTYLIDLGNNFIKSISFVSRLIGFFIGNESLYKTLDGGLNWNLSTNEIDGSHPVMFFVDTLNGYAANCDAMGPCRGLKKTIDGGKTWFRIKEGDYISGYYTSISFINNNIGYIGESNGKILKTETGGIVKISEIKETSEEEFKLKTNNALKYAVIEYNLNENSLVQLIISDLLGRKVSTPLNLMQNRGNYSTNINLSNLKKGLYLYAYSINNKLIKTGKILIF